MNTKTVTLKNGEAVTLTETETEYVIEASDWGIEESFGARLEIGTAFCTPETALEAFEAVCKAIESEVSPLAEETKTETKESEGAWETLLVILGETTAALSKPEAEKLLKAIKAFPNEAYPEFELDILVTLENAAKEAIEYSEGESLQNFCRVLYEAITVSLSEETNTAIWNAFKKYQSALKGEAVPEEDLRDIFEAIVTGLT